MPRYQTSLKHTKVAEHNKSYECHAVLSREASRVVVMRDRGSLVPKIAHPAQHAKEHNLNQERVSCQQR